MEHFYGKNSSGVDTGRNKTGYYKPADTGDIAFDYAWLLHQKRADHHWQWWILAKDERGLKILEMSEDARNEMICDWLGASRAQGHGGIEGVFNWYTDNYHRLQLHPETRHLVEKTIKERFSKTHIVKSVFGGD